MELSNRSLYALLSLLALAKCYESGESLHIREMAERQYIPKRYLEQLLATLRRGGLIKSIRGSKGGYVLAREPDKITLLDALCCIEGFDSVKSSQSSTAETPDAQVIWEIWQEVSQVTDAALQKYTLQDLCERQADNQAGYMYYI